MPHQKASVVRRKSGRISYTNLKQIEQDAASAAQLAQVVGEERVHGAESALTSRPCRLDENSHLLQPPVNNYCVYRDGGTVMVSRPQVRSSHV